jgi:predicted secreted protein
VLRFKKRLTKRRNLVFHSLSAGFEDKTITPQNYLMTSKIAVRSTKTVEIMITQTLTATAVELDSPIAAVNPAPVVVRITQYPGASELSLSSSRTLQINTWNRTHEITTIHATTGDAMMNIFLLKVHDHSSQDLNTY